MGEKEEAELGAAPQPAPDCSALQPGPRGPWGSVSCVFGETKCVLGGGPCYPEGSVQEAGLRPRKGAEVHAVHRQVPSSPSCSLRSARPGCTLSATHKLKALAGGQVPDVQNGLLCPCSPPVILFY